MTTTKSRPLRLAIVAHIVKRNDGQGRVNYEISKAALDRGHQVTIIGESCAIDIANHHNGRFICFRTGYLPTHLLRLLYFAMLSARWLKKHHHEFDIVQVNGFATWHRGEVAAAHFVHGAWLRNARYPYRWLSFSPYAFYQRLYTLLNARWEMKAFTAARVIVAVSQLVAKEIEALGVPSDKIRVVHNGVDSEEFCPGESERVVFGLPEQVPLALFIGDIRTSRKNLDTVLRSMQFVPELHLVIAGKTDGSPYPELARVLGINDRVHFLGAISNVPALMRSVDILVCPSRYEPYGLVALEAAAIGLPTILSANAGASECIGKKCKIIEDPNDIGILATAMAELIGQPDEARNMGMSARELAREMQWSRTANGYIDIYKDLTGY